MTMMAWLPVLICILSKELIISRIESEEGSGPLSGHLVWWNWVTTTASGAPYDVKNFTVIRN